jgi:diadenosine tetraphosphate (Ap4A) HIT family hydrolase
MTYNPQNIFAKILRGEIPCQKFYENDYAIAFPDLHPKSAVHILVIPKGPYMSFQDFTEHATHNEVVGFWNAVHAVTGLTNIRQSGYRVLTNDGPNAHQEVSHFHVHVLGGEPLGRMVGR